MINKSCKYCTHYQYEEIGDSDYGAIYSDSKGCLKNYDVDDYGIEFSNFDRNIERNCCSYDFWEVLECDDELNKLFVENNGDINKMYDIFKQKYN